MKIPLTNYGYKIWFEKKIPKSKLIEYLIDLNFKKLENNLSYCNHFINKNQKIEIIINDNYLEKTDLVETLLIQPILNEKITHLIISYHIIKKIVLELFDSFDIVITTYLNGPKLNRSAFIKNIEKTIKSLQKNETK